MGVALDHVIWSSCVGSTLPCPKKFNQLEIYQGHPLNVNLNANLKFQKFPKQTYISLLG